MQMFGGRRRGIGMGRQQPGIGLILLGLQMAQVGVNRIPPVTLATIGAQVAIFLKILDFKWPHLSDVCISPVTVWYREDYTRLLTAAFFHADDWHLYYNMASFLWKGISLEKRLGGGYFLYMLAVFTLLCNVTTVGLGFAAEYLLHDPSYLSQCAVGFSGVIFALKVVTTHMLPPGVTRIMGIIPIHSRYACWAELVLIQLLVPRASFLGHLAGILVGTAYCKGPLKHMMNFLVTRAPSYTYRAAPSGSRDSSYGYTTGASGYRSNYNSDPGAQHGYNTRSSQPTSDYTGGLNEDDQMQEAMRQSLNDAATRRANVPPSAPPPQPPPGPGTGPGLYPDLSPYTTGAHSGPQHASGHDAEELRRRRLNRFT